MAQPVSGVQWTKLSGTAAGTTILTTTPSVIQTITIPANNTGTVTFYDSVSGTASTTEVFSLACTTGTIPTTLRPGLQTKKGIVAVLGGTTNMTVGWE